MNEQLREAGVPESPDTAGGHDAFGTPLQSFQPSLWARIIVIACGVVMLLAGTLIIIASYSEPSGYLSRRVGCGLVVLGPVICLLAYRLGSHRLLVCPGGIVRIRGRVQEHCRWDEISEIVVTCDRTRWVSSRRCSLAKRDGSRIALVDVAVGRFPLLVDTLRRMAALHSISWKETGAPGQRGNWMDWVYYGVIGIGIIMLVVVGLVLLSAK
jgi:hypothetical protein